ncbi:hypothetical protein [Silvanigrella aquatica]|uniref:Uncharacterized protein n=1 Tax=Silvanigrella aquatica TaxID=1915309 RepID=A0A1L4D0X0_9BACT|nr:hypothetical protein [Silvanigrella aquatica]APJ03834.1 hypothetical protein AXG55_07915 [Silvanigrella aquatica]
MYKIKHFIFKIIILIFCILLLSCRRISTQQASFSVNEPTFNGAKYSSYAGFTKIQIPIQITNSSGYNYQGTLQTGANSIQIPNGTVTIKVGFLAQGYNSSSSSACKSSNDSDNNEDQSALYTEFNGNFSIDDNTNSININFPNPFSVINFDHFGFIIYTPSGLPAVNANVTFFDPISGSPLLDPCTNTPFSSYTDSQGRLAQDIPIYNSSKLFGFIVTLSDGTVQKFLPTLPRGATNAQFYKMNMSDGTLASMNDQSDSFLGDGNTIAYRRDTLHKNPRFPDFSNYTLNYPDYSSGKMNLYPNNSSAQQYDLINSRKLIFYCQVYNYTGPVPSPPYPICKRDISNILTYPLAITANGSYVINSYITDTEGYNASDKSPSNPATITFSVPLSPP